MYMHMHRTINSIHQYIHAYIQTCMHIYVYAHIHIINTHAWTSFTTKKATAQQRYGAIINTYIDINIDEYRYIYMKTYAYIYSKTCDQNQILKIRYLLHIQPHEIGTHMHIKVHTYIYIYIYS